MFGSGFGGDTVARAIVELVGDTAQVQRDFDQARGTVGDATDDMASRTQRFQRASAVAFAIAGAAAVKFAVDSVRAYMEAEKVATETNRVIESTGGIANVSAEEVSSLAESIRDYSGQSDEAVASAANLLLTFTHVRNEVGEGNDIFDQAVVAATDMAQVLGKDLPAASMMLGKALNDPITGSTALRRAGVSLTEQQREQIATFVESGDILSAQKIILEELAVEFGGAAAAFGETAQGQAMIVKEQFGDIQEAVGGLILKGGKPVLEWVSTMVNAFRELPTPIKLGASAVAAFGIASATATPAVLALDAAVAKLGFSAGTGGLLGMLSRFAPLLAEAGAAAFIWAKANEDAANAGKEVTAYGETQSEFLQRNAEDYNSGEISLRRYLDAMEHWNEQTKSHGEIAHISQVEALKYATALEEGVDPAQAAAEAQAELAQQTQSAADAARDARIAQLQLAGGFLGIQGSIYGAKDAQISMREAQTAVNDLLAKGKKGTAEYKAAVRDLRRAELDAVESQASLASAVAEYIDEEKGGTATRREAIDLTRQFARDAGLTKAATDRLIGTVLQHIRTLDGIPNNVNTKIMVGNIDLVMSQTQRWKDLLDRIPREIVTIMQVRAASAPAAGHVTGVASGGVIAGANGFITGGPTFLVGEGSGRTLAGPGAEAVIPFDQRGIGILSKAIAQAGGGGMSRGDLAQAMHEGLRRLFVHERHLVADLFGPRVELGRSLSFPLRGAE